LVGLDEMNRDRTTIMADILAFCTRPAPKTRVMYKTNLTYKQLKTYLAFLTSVGLIEHYSNEYLTTAKGYNFLRAYAALENLLDGGAAYFRVCPWFGALEQ